MMKRSLYFFLCALLASLSVNFPLQAESEEKNKLSAQAYEAFQLGQYKSALALALDASEQGERAARSLIGYLYEEGLGIARSPLKAIDWYKIAALDGDKNAMFRLYELYSLPDTSFHDAEAAKNYLYQAVEQEQPEALYALGENILLKTRDNSNETTNLHKQVAKYFMRAAELGDMDAQFALARQYQAGAGIEQDLSQAAFWMGEAARAGHIPAQISYGVMIFTGQGVVKDETLAARYFMMAARLGNPIGMNRLARIYATGRGLQPDPVAALAWHFRAKSVGLQDEWLDAFMQDQPEQIVTAASKLLPAEFQLSSAANVEPIYLRTSKKVKTQSVIPNS